MVHHSADGTVSIEAFNGLRTGGGGVVGSELDDRQALICVTWPPSFSQRSMARAKRLRGDGDSAFMYLPLHGLIDLQLKRYCPTSFLRKADFLLTSERRVPQSRRPVPGDGVTGLSVMTFVTEPNVQGISTNAPGWRPLFELLPSIHHGRE
jgi:hypothetical protein